MYMIVDNRLAREVLSEHKIEMDPTDSRSAEEYVLQIISFDRRTTKERHSERTEFKK